MIKKLKLIPMGIMCLLVLCALGVSLNAQSSTAESSQFDFSSYLQQMKNLDIQEQSLLAEPLTEKSANQLEIINQKRATLIESRNSTINVKTANLVVGKTEGTYNSTVHKSVDEKSIEGFDPSFMKVDQTTGVIYVKLRTPVQLSQQ